MCVCVARVLVTKTPAQSLDCSFMKYIICFLFVPFKHWEITFSLKALFMILMFYDIAYLLTSNMAHVAYKYCQQTKRFLNYCYTWDSWDTLLRWGPVSSVTLDATDKIYSVAHKMLEAFMCNGSAHQFLLLPRRCYELSYKLMQTQRHSFGAWRTLHINMPRKTMRTHFKSALWLAGAPVLNIG